MEDETPLHVPLGSSQLENLALAIKSFFMCGWLGDGLFRFPFKRELAMRVEVGWQSPAFAIFEICCCGQAEVKISLDSFQPSWDPTAWPSLPSTGLLSQPVCTWSSVALAKTFSELHQSELLPAQSSLETSLLILPMDDRAENAAWKAFPAYFWSFFSISSRCFLQ